MDQTLVVIAGLPLSGKTTLGYRLTPILNMHYCDSDELRQSAFGVLTQEEYQKRWENPEQATMLTQEDMKLSYMLLHATIDISLRAHRSLIVSATYSRKSTQEFLKKIVNETNAKLRMLLCKLQNETREEIERRLRRDDKSEFVYGTKTLVDYETNKSRFESPDTTGIFSPSEILTVDTSSAETVVLAMDRIMEFILE